MRHRMQLGLLLGVGVGVLLSLGLGAQGNATKQGSAEAQIRAVLDMQSAAWNRGDIDTFMTGYWKSEETEFVGASGITRGWRAVLERYRRNYPDPKAMGRLDRKSVV